LEEFMMKRSKSPIFWALFGAGGMLCALLGTGLVWITGIAVPLGLGLPSDLLSYPRVIGLGRSVWGGAGLFLVVSLFAWHAAHRLLCTVHDFGIHKGLMAKTLAYGSAGVLTLLAGTSLLKL
jgi:fumarate reductase subunit D